MNSEEIYNKWQDFLRNELDPSGMLSPLDLPFLFSNPCCATCSYWFLLNGEELHLLGMTSIPRIYENIINGFNGKQTMYYKDKEDLDVFNIYRFYGKCKRFPPSHRNEYYCPRAWSFFSFFKKNILQKYYAYDFPLLPHDCSCGEWKQDGWVKDFIMENAPRYKEKIFNI